MRSLSRNISAPLSKAMIMEDVSEGSSIKMSPNTSDDYLNALRRIHVLETMPSWNPNLRSKTAIRTSPTIHHCDPAVAAYFLSAHAEDLIMIDTDRMNGPSFLAIIVPCGYAFTREDGVHVISITCLRE